MLGFKQSGRVADFNARVGKFSDVIGPFGEETSNASRNRLSLLLNEVE